MNEVSDKKLAQLNALMELTALVNSTLDTHEVRKRANKLPRREQRGIQPYFFESFAASGGEFDPASRLKNHAGRQFDPLAVDAFLKAWREMEIVL